MRKSYLNNFITVLLFIFLTCKFLQAQKQNLSNQETFELEQKARNVSKNWSGESIRHSNFLLEQAITKQTSVKDFKGIINNLRQITKQEILLGEYKKALLTIKKALKLEKENKLEKDSSSSFGLYLIALLNLGKFGETKNLLDEIKNKINPNASSDANALINFASAELTYNQRNFEQAEKFYQESIKNWKEINDVENEAYTLVSYSYVFMAIGKSLIGLEKAKEAEQKFIEMSNNRGIALSKIAIGHLYNSLDKKQQALENYVQAESLFPNDMDFIENARLLNGIGLIYEDFGQWKLSLQYRQKAFIAFGRANYPIGQLATLPSLVKLSYLTGEDLLANEYYLKTQEISKQLKDKFYLAITKKQIADHFFETNQNDLALNTYKDSLSIIEKFSSDAEVALLKNNVGTIYLRMGKLDIARKYYEDSLLLSNKVQDKFGETQTSFNLANLFILENKKENALEEIKKSINLTENLYSDVANSNLKRSYFSNVYDRYELYIHLLMQKHKESPSENFAIQALQASEKSRARSLLETLRLSESNFTKDANPELVAREKELRNLLNIKADKLTELLSNNAEQSEIDKIDDERRTLDNELETIKADLKQNSPIYSAIKNPTPFDVAEFQKNTLDEKSVLLEFSFGEKESYLWLISKNEVLSFVLPAREVLENRIDKIRKSFDERQILQGEDIETYNKRIADLEQISKDKAKLLSNELFGQIVEKIADKRLIIVPDGKLSLLPISALPFPNSDSSFINYNEIVYQPSASILNILPKLQTHKSPPTKDLLVFADPIFDDTDNRLTAKNENQSFLPTILGLNLRDFRLADANGKIPRLFATETEANSIAEAVGKTRTEILSGFAANREKVLDSTISDYRMLHFATHGLVDVQRPEVSSIVLSQFDENGQKKEGFLRLQDIYSLDLASDLVVLSACQSGIGKEIKGEGLMSLNNAFLQAGAKSVLSSAWKVDDDATAEFMKRFYTNLVNKRLTTSEALRQTQIEMVNSTQFKSPFYWAAFTIQGEFRQPISVSNNYFYYILFGILGIIGIGLLWRFRRKLFNTENTVTAENS